MVKFIVFVFFVVGVANAGHVQEGMHGNVKKFLETLIKDSTVSDGFLSAKKSGFFHDSVKIKDLGVRALEVYQLKHIFLDAHPDTVPFSEIIEPTGRWLVMITAHNKPLYQVFLKNTEEGPVTVGRSPLTRNHAYTDIWEQLLKVDPESTGITPVYFSRYGHTFGVKERFLYFRQKGHRKIHYIPFRLDDAALKTLFTAPIETLDDSKKLIEYWKKNGLNEVGIHGYNRAKNEDTK
ncbi:MAG: hypothetical protein LBB56_00770 [Chitinispirillales bacterium]|jgi:hypothetical protein|nr:hypothetical protein [Chitinispirillales bacterium]